MSWYIIINIIRAVDNILMPFIVILRILVHVHCFPLNVADAWPQVFDDSKARADWRWSPSYDIDRLVDIMIDNLRPIYDKKKKQQQQQTASSKSKWGKRSESMNAHERYHVSVVVNCMHL